jgi:hypothetical protein
MGQEPPVLYKFLLALLEEPCESGESPAVLLNSVSMDASVSQPAIVNPFPVIATVTKRTMKTIKIYALIALSTRKSFRHLGFNELLAQLFFKVNFSG